MYPSPRPLAHADSASPAACPPNRFGEWAGPNAKRASRKGTASLAKHPSGINAIKLPYGKPSLTRSCSGQVGRSPGFGPFRVRHRGACPGRLPPGRRGAPTCRSARLTGPFGRRETFALGQVQSSVKKETVPFYDGRAFSPRAHASCGPLPPRAGIRPRIAGRAAPAR